jgi:hypothetical protein
MNAIRLIGAGLGMAFGFASLVVGAFMLGWGWSDSGSKWTGGQWAIAVIPWSLPYWVSCGVVYWCLGRNVKYTVIAEAVVLAAAAGVLWRGGII